MTLKICYYLFLIHEAISQVVKYDNSLFQRCQNQHSKQHTVCHAPTMLASRVNFHSEIEDMQIDAVRVKTFIPEEKKRHMEEGLCLYCGEEGHKAGNGPKKKN